ncbi:glycosyltransferase family 2 protein [Roseburia faecis]|uniref:glycosyltransferase family 2 protein n=1 Tax=Roseburia faecis TaxID=301302 RepID=UPI003F9A57AC
MKKDKDKEYKLKENILVSVIVPVYNTEKYIERCLKSLKEQTYKNIEVILIDDGSTDNTLHVCEKYKREDRRFSFTTKTNTGVSDTRNIGIEKAKGKYVVFVDSDDYVENDYIETLVQGMESYDVQMACVEYKIISGNNQKLHRYMEKDVCMNAESAINCLGDQRFFQGYLWNKIFVKDIILNNNLTFDTNIRLCEDMLFCLKYLGSISNVIYLHQAVYNYVQREGSVLNDTDIWKENSLLTALESMWMIVQDIPGEFKEYIRNFYANDLVGMLGRNNYTEKNSIINAMEIIKQLQGKLTLKHKIKLMIFKLMCL